MTKFLETLLIILFWLFSMGVGMQTGKNTKNSGAKNAVILFFDIILLAWVISKVIAG